MAREILGDGGVEEMEYQEANQEPDHHDVLSRDMDRTGFENMAYVASEVAEVASERQPGRNNQA